MPLKRACNIYDEKKGKKQKSVRSESRSSGTGPAPHIVYK